MMWRYLRLLFCLSLVLLTFKVVPVRAADSLTLVANEPFVISYRIQVEPTTAYRLKVRLSQSPTQCQLECSGETWNGSDWLKQTTSWQSFPLVTADTQGVIEGVAIGRPGVMDTDLFVHLAVRPDQGTLVTIAQTWPVVFAHPTQHVMVVSPSAPPPGAYFALTESTSRRLIPLFSSTTPLSLTEEKFNLQLIGANGSSLAQASYVLSGPGGYRLVFPPGPALLFHPRLTVEQERLFPAETNRVHLQTEEAFAGMVEWYIDGEKQSNTSSELIIKDSLPGQHVVTAVLPLSQELSTATFEVRPYTAVKIESLIPNPAGRDTGQERLVLHNNHDVPAVLKGWYLKGRTTSSSLPITVTIPAGQSWSVVGSNRLVNSGSTYDLYDDTQRLIDTVTYGVVQEGDVIRRNGLEWQGETVAAKGIQGEDGTTSRADIRGTVVAPQGKTFDVRQSDGATVHVVIHSSFNGLKPRFHAGDSVHVTGLWQQSKKGSYISVRLGDSLDLVVLHTAASSMARRSAPSQAKLGALVPRAQAAEVTGSQTAFLSGMESPAVTPPVLLSVHSPPWLRELFALILTIGLLFVVIPPGKSRA